ncbi:MAG: hypothetical protein ACJA08_001269 [Cyclobacteriaceae bacterium]
MSFFNPVKEESKNTAILFFSRSARSESESKAWIPGQDKHTNENLAKALISNTKKALFSSGFPVYHINEHKQVGNTFGEKLANAFEDLFDLGYQSVISVGNDCIHLMDVDWHEISDSFQANKNVLGPDFRNGAYLIGLRKEDFHKNTFAHLSWQADDLFDDLTNYLTNVTILAPLRDFNDSRDLYLLKKESTWLKRLLRQLITFDFSTDFGHSGDWGNDPNNSYGRRGPPSIF